MLGNVSVIITASTLSCGRALTGNLLGKAISTSTVFSTTTGSMRETVPIISSRLVSIIAF